MNIQEIQKSTILEPKQFHRRLEAIFEQLNTSVRNDWLPQLFLSGFKHYLAADLEVCAIHLYDASFDPPDLLSSWGKSVPSVEAMLREHSGSEPFPWFLKWNGSFAAVFPFGEEADLVFVFFFHETLEELIFSSSLATYFSTLHYALVQHFRRLKLQDALEEAREIQLSLLPAGAPRFSGFDIAARTIPAKIVGGDVYDFFQTGEDALTILIADAAGHGLPAALQARDVITGLRMGFEKGMQLNYVIEKLNRVIHRSGLVSRFISLVSGQLQKDGTFFYINAGHPAPILMRESRFEQLRTGGMILGPRLDQPYEMGSIQMQPGDSLLFYSDGILEHSSSTGVEFGIEGIIDWMRSCQTSGESCIDDLFNRLQSYGNGRPFQDDASVVFVKRVS
jgi:serine phosphatase RsbU (regulator of sigma subunit)